MRIDTKHFGTIDVDEKSVIEFAQGLCGFEEVRKYVVLNGEDGSSPFRWLQGVDEPGLAFAIVDPFSIKPDYDVNLSDEDVKSLKIEKPEDVLVYSIVVVPEDIAKISMNLKAPVIINGRNNKGMQVILDTEEYGVRHYIVDELRRQEVNTGAGSYKKKGAVHSNK